MKKRVGVVHTFLYSVEGSMFHLLPLIGDIGVPVLTSLETGVEQLKKYV